MPNDVRLRGNTFILLLLRAANGDLSANGGWGVKGSGITKPGLLLDLLKMIKPTHSPNMNTLAQYFSAYMEGTRPDSQTAYPFFTPAFRDLFTKRMHEDYGDLLLEMDSFCRKYLDYNNRNVRRQLVAGILLGLGNDSTISSNAEFDSGYEKIQKRQFKDITRFKLQPFLLSTWFYLVTKKYDASEAKETYREWTGEAEANTAPPITTAIGLKYSEKIEVEFDESINPEIESPYVDTIEEEPEIIEAEVVEEAEPLEAKTVVKEGRIYQQQAQTIYNIEHIDVFKA